MTGVNVALILIALACWAGGLLRFAHPSGPFLGGAGFVLFGTFLLTSNSSILWGIISIVVGLIGLYIGRRSHRSQVIAKLRRRQASDE